MINQRASQLLQNLRVVQETGFDVAILSSSIRNFGFKKNIHVWITAADFENANLMILMAYIIMGHKDWRNGNIKIFALFPKEELEFQKNIKIEAQE